MPRAWHLDETKDTLLQAAWKCIEQDARSGDVTLDINSVLSTASDLWSERYPSMKRRVFTRGAIMNIWGTVGTFQRQCVLNRLEEYEEASLRSADELESRIDDAHTLSDTDAEEAVERALAEFARSQLEVRRKTAEITQYLRLLSRHGLSILQVEIHRLYSTRDERTAKILVRVCEALGSHASPNKLAVGFNTIIEGAVIRSIADYGRPPALDEDIAATIALLPRLLCHEPRAMQTSIDKGVAQRRFSRT